MSFTKPIWSEQGPGPLAMPMGTYSISAGAVQALVVDPVDANRVFVASVGGGVWRSNDALSPVPTWVPQTDQCPSLSMSALALSPLDPSRDTLYAGCGRTTHGAPLVGPSGGPLFGLLKTLDGGTHWSEIARAEFEGKFVARILPLAVRSWQGDRVLVATWQGGLHVSSDGGTSWSVSTHVPAPVTDVAVEPTNALSVFVAAPPKIWISSDGGGTDWHDVSPPDWGNLANWATIRLTISPGTDAKGQHWIYAAATGAANGQSVMFSRDQGATWFRLGQPPDGSNPLAPLAVSPLSPATLFCATDAGSPNHYMATASPGHATQWTRVEGADANGTGPHTDARDSAFSRDGSVLFETNDGGIARLSSPYSSTRTWSQAVGNLRTAEFHSVAYDSINHIIFGATQDNAIPQQTLVNGTNWTINEQPIGDGFCVDVDVSSTPNSAIHYSSQQNLFQFVRRTYTASTQSTTSQGLGLVIAGTGGLHYNQVEGAINSNGGLGTVRWNQDFVVNVANPKRILFGTNFLYESFDQGDTFTALGGLAQNSNREWIPANAVGTVTAYAYGHTGNTDVIYVGAGGRLLHRAGASGLPQQVATYPGTDPVGIALDSVQWRRAYVLDSDGRIFRTTDAGATTQRWSELTGDLPRFTTDLRTLVVLPRSGTNDGEVVIVGGYGGVYVTKNPGDGRYAMWRKHGVNFPNAVVSKVVYSAADDVLVAGTFGRSAWLLTQASYALRFEPSLKIVSSQRLSCVRGWIEHSTVTFSAAISNGGGLSLPLSYEWTIAGAAPNSGTDQSSVVAEMPSAGNEVIVMLRVTDATGYQTVGSVGGQTVTEQVAILRDRLCALLAKIKHEQIFHVFINPLGPDGPPDLAPDASFERLELDTTARLPEYGRLAQLMGTFAALLKELSVSDRTTVRQRGLYAMSESAMQRWRRLEETTVALRLRTRPSDSDIERASQHLL